MKHIFGMAKSHLDLKGSNRTRLELDYLRLVYAVRDMRTQGDDARGYFIVMTNGVLRRVGLWEHQYQGKSYVDVIIPSVTGNISPNLENDRTLNLSRMVVSTIWNKDASRSATTISRQMGENILTEIMQQLEPSVQQIKDENKFPLGIRWDFYGIAGN